MKKMLENLASKINPQFVIIIGTLITMLGAYLATLRADEQTTNTKASIEENKKISLKNIDLSNKNNALSQENKELLTQNLDYAKLQKGLSDINIKLTEEVKEKSNTIDEYNKGTGSYCTLDIMVNNDNNSGTLVFLGEGKNPLRDIGVRVVDLNEERSTNINNGVIEFSLGNMYPGQAKTTPYSIKIDKSKGVRLNIFYSSNNGFIAETLRMYYINNNWERENIVYDYIHPQEKPLMLKRSENYPVEKHSY